MGIFGKMSDKFSLKWNDFHTNAAKSFSLFRNDDYLQDVTLVADDHKQISAHKLVLSACSDYFNNIFKNSKHSHLTVCLDGVNNQDLNNILDYIYNGEVQIYQDDLDRFLTVAQRLKLQGLLGDDKNEGKQEQMVEEHKIKEEVTDSVIIDDQENQNVNESDYRGSSVSIPANHEGLDNLNEKLNEYMDKCQSGGYKCKLCGKMSGLKNAKQNMTFHVETHIEGLSFTCQICQKSFRSRRTLNY